MDYKTPRLITRFDNWSPEFSWVLNPIRCAKAINLPHEDYPDRVSATLFCLIRLFQGHKDTVGGLSIPNNILKDLHGIMFVDEPFTGQFRNRNVTVSTYWPPSYTLVTTYMKELEYKYQSIDSIEELESWYYDFESIHPFQDGNGRVGGVVVGAFSRIIRPFGGFWLSPNQ